MEDTGDATLEVYDPHQGVDPNQPVDPPRYEPVAVGKFIVLNLATFTVYTLVWFYRNWRYIKERDQSNMLPFFRAVFAPLWYFALIRDLRAQEGAFLSQTLAVGYLVLNVGSYRLPDPYWIVGLLAFLTVLPAVAAVNQINERHGLASRPSGRWRGRSVAMSVVGIPFLMFSVLASFGPRTYVTDGSQVSGRQVQFLRDVGILESDDQLLFFYSPGVISAKGEGAALTQRGVGVYWTDMATGERSVQFAPFGQIADIDIDPSTSWIVDTYVTLTLVDGSQFGFVLSAERNRDDAFVEEMERLWR